MTFGASGSGRGGCSSARLFLLSITVLVLALAGAGAEQGQPGGGSPPPVTLGTLISGSCLEVQRYAESVVGSGVIRSAAEVQTISAPMVAITTVSLTRKWLHSPLFPYILISWVFLV